MAKESKNKTLHYRQVGGLKDGRSLEELLRQILYHSHTKVADRWEELGGDEPNSTLRRFINRRRDNNAMVFGELVLYEGGRNREALTLAEEEEELPTEQVALPATEEGHRREFLESSLYFGVDGNHLIVVESRTLTSRELENHLRWLVSEQAQSLEDGEIIQLERGLSVLGTDALKNVKAIYIGAPVFDDRPQPKTGTQGNVEVTHHTLGRKLLEQMLGHDDLNALNIDQYADADLRVELKITRKDRTRKTDDETARNAMEALTSALRHQHPEDIKLDTKRVGKIKGDTLFLSTSKKVVHWNVVPDIEDMFHQMHDWLTECITNGTIQP